MNSLDINNYDDVLMNDSTIIDSSDVDNDDVEEQEVIPGAYSVWRNERYFYEERRVQPLPKGQELSASRGLLTQPTESVPSLDDSTSQCSSTNNSNYEPCSEETQYCEKKIRKRCFLIAFLSILTVLFSVIISVLVVAMAGRSTSENDVTSNSVLTASTPVVTGQELKELLGGSDSFGADLSSPENRAIEWLAVDAHVQSQAEYPLRLLQQRFALATLWISTNAEESWYSGDSWLEPVSVCEWEFILCDDAQQDVIKVVMASNQLQGTIPKEIAYLSMLQVLNLNNNLITGSIPSRFGEHLADLQLALNDLEGSIPPTLFASTKLQRLLLEQNRLSGPIPEDVSKISASMTALFLGKNKLTGTLPESLYELRQLKELSLGGNAISGSLSTSIGNFRNLYYLHLVYNSLTGPIPHTIGLMTSLEHLELSNNYLSSTLPTELGALTRLAEFTINDNLLTGTMSSEIGHLTNLVTFICTRNKFRGLLPTEALANLTNLASLKMSLNNFSGTIPSSLCAHVTPSVDCRNIVCECCDNDLSVMACH